MQRNDGILAESLAAQVTREWGIDFQVLQNNSRHGVDLVGYDPVKRQYVVIEVKSSTVGGFGAAPPDPAKFLVDRAALAAQGQGFWEMQNTPVGIQDLGETIRTNIRAGATVVGYKFEVALPKPRQSDDVNFPPVTLKIKQWGGS